MNTTSFRHSITQLQVKFAALQPREQKALLLLSSAVSLVLIWSLLIAPAMSYYKAEQQRYQRHVALSHWIAAHENQFKRQVSTVRPVGNDWINLITRSATQQGVQVRSFTPEGSQAVRIQLENQSFSSVIPWLAGLSEQYGILPSQTDISASSTVGLVNVRLTLRKP